MKKPHITIIAILFVFVTILVSAQNAAACDNILVVNEGTPYEEQFHLCDTLYSTNIRICEIGTEARIYSACEECGEVMVNSVSNICKTCQTEAANTIKTKERLKKTFPLIVGLMTITIVCFVLAAIRFKNIKKTDSYYEINRKDLTYILGNPMTVMIISAVSIPFLIAPFLMFITI